MNNNLSVEARKTVNDYIRGTAILMSKKPEKIHTIIESNYISIEEYIDFNLFKSLVMAKYNMLVMDLF